MELNKDSKAPVKNSIKAWFQDNLRIIISILIVVLIAGGIYSYSNRTESPESPIADLNDAENIISESEEEVVANSDKKEETEATDQEKDSVSSIATSQETEKSFIQTAAKGDSQTTLARAALANFLEKNPNSELTSEHKIYIEDYLRKKINYEGRIFTGTSLEFQKDLIQEAISHSKNLTPDQLKNLQKYVVKVPSLS
jgi:hypothetical protein